MNRIPVAILGATGAVGQRLVQLLSVHPWFRVEVLAASARSAGQSYGEAVRWMLPGEPPESLRELPVTTTEPVSGVAIAFSALDASVAGEVEQAWAMSGSLVSSNSRNHRMEPDVPLIIPEVNPDHFDLLPAQRANRGFAEQAGIVTNPNCSTIGLAMVLAPLDRAFGVREVLVTTLQAASGAGYPGIPSLDLLGNTVPFIAGEEEKMEIEARKILGTIGDGAITDADLRLSASVNRVPVVDGHSAATSIRLRDPASVDDVKQVLATFRGEPQERSLPTAPERAIEVLEAEDRPQAARDVNRGGGMTVTVGRVRVCSVLGIKMTVLSHNTIRGAAGAAVLNVETLLARTGNAPT